MARPDDLTLRGSPWVVVALATLLGVRLAVGGTLGIVDDEAYYWAWSRHLAWGYFDHPPGVAVAVALGDALFGPSSLGVRFGPILCSTLAFALLVPLARDRALALLLLAGTPLLGLGTLIAVPDAVLVLGWAIAVRCAARGDWLLVGVGVAVAALGKMHGWGLWPLLLLAEPRSARAMLPGIALTLVLTAPHLAWSATHGGMPFAFQLSHGLDPAHGGASGGAPGVAGAAQFVGAQLALASPLVALGVAAAALQWPNDRVGRVLWVTAVVPLVFFALAASRARAEANWAMPAWLSAMVLLARAERWSRVAWVGGGLGAAMTLAATIHLYTPIARLADDPRDRLGLGRSLAQSVEAWGIDVVYTERYQEAAVLRYYQGLRAYALPGVGRPDQFDLWYTPAADRAIFVRPWRGGPTLPTDDVCVERGTANAVVERDADGLPLARWQVVEVTGCTP